MKHFNQLSKITLACMFVCLNLVHAATVTINYASAGRAGHLQSNSAPLGSDTFVEMGAFSPGFVPTAANRNVWLANWTRLHRVNYHAGLGTFSGVANLESNVSPFTTSNRIWLWVYNRDGDWCLYSNSSWTWPNTSGVSPRPLNCSPANANIVVAGTVSNSTPRLVCEKVTNAGSPKVSFTEWANSVLPPGLRGKNQDADGDGQSNIMEYALGSDPNRRSEIAQVVAPRSVAGLQHLGVRVNRGWGTGVNYVVQWSDNLITWHSTGLQTVVDTPTTLEVIDPNPTGFFQRRFMRVQVVSED
jgi:hypothetical protein